jgi:hypothetical protein
MDFLKDADGNILRDSDQNFKGPGCDCDCVVCYYQARTCPKPGTLVDIWIKAADLPGLPFHFYVNGTPGTYYYIPDTAVCGTPGTIVPIANVTQITPELCAAKGAPGCCRYEPMGCCWHEDSIYTADKYVHPDFATWSAAAQAAYTAMSNALTAEVNPDGAECRTWVSKSPIYTEGGIDKFFYWWIHPGGSHWNYNIESRQVDGGGHSGIAVGDALDADSTCCSFAMTIGGQAITGALTGNKCCRHNPENYPTWTIGVTYAAGDIVNVGGDVYVSLQNGNLNHGPGAIPDLWWALAPCGEADSDSCPDGTPTPDCPV